MTDGATKGEGGKITVRVDRDLEDLIPGYMEGRRKDVNTILSCLEAGDYETVQWLGHGMKGSGGGYGFDRITELGRSIEEAAKRNDREEIEKQTADLSSYIERVEITYE